MTKVKVVDNKAYIKRGSIGRGWSALKRAASIRDQLGLSDFPQDLPEQEWENLNAEPILVESHRPPKRVPTPKPQKE